MQPYHYFIFTYKGILCKHFGRNSNCTVTVTSTVTCLVIILSFGLSRSGCLFLSVCPCLMLNLTNPCCTGVSPIISRRRTRRTADLRPRVEVYKQQGWKKLNQSVFFVCFFFGFFRFFNFFRILLNFLGIFNFNLLSFYHIDINNHKNKFLKYDSYFKSVFKYSRSIGNQQGDLQ